MNYNKEVLENKQVKYTVVVDSADWKEALKGAYNKTKGEYVVEGFRKGKVPMSVIIRRYGMSKFFDTALDIILPKLYGEILDDDKELEPVDHPDVDIVAISDTDLTVSFSVTVKPEVKLGQYKGLELEKVAVAEVNEDAINAELLKAQEKIATWENVTDRAAQKFDQVVIDYSGSVDGVKFEGGTAEKQTLELGSGMFIPGFEEQVEGMNIGDERDITVKFPEDYGATELAGKDAVFAIKLHEIKAKNMPALDDEFAKDVSEFDTLDEYKADIKANLEKKATESAQHAMEDKVLEAIVESTEIDIPDVMIENQVEDMISEFEYRLMYQGMKAEDYYKYTNSSRDELKIRYNASATKQVKLRLVMEAIVKAENITAAPEEIDAKVADFAKGANKSVEDYKKSMHPQEVAYIENEIITNNLIAFLMANNKFA